MGEKAEAALREALLELSPNKLVAIELELNKDRMVSDIMDRDLDDIIMAVDRCLLHEKVFHHINKNHSLGGESIGKEE